MVICDLLRSVSLIIEKIPAPVISADLVANIRNQDFPHVFKRISLPISVRPLKWPDRNIPFFTVF
jgi:hypothetical protein